MRDSSPLLKPWASSRNIRESVIIITFDSVDTIPPMQQETKKNKALLGGALLVAFLLATFVMRGPVTCVGPVAQTLREVANLDAVGYGVLTALPIVAFGVFSFAGPRLARRIGLSKAIQTALILLSLGAALRMSWGLSSLPLLFLATVLVGAGIALLNVYMPVMVKTLWLSRMGLMMGIYTGVIGFSGAIGGLSSAPLLENYQTLSAPFGLWTLAGIVASIAWYSVQKNLPETTKSSTPSEPHHTTSSTRSTGTSWHTRLRDPLAWALTGVMGLQSLLIYTAAGWMPTYWQTNGMSASETGFWLFVYLLSGLPASIFTARFLALLESEALTGIVLATLYLLGFVGWIAGGVWMLPASIVSGAMQGAMLSYAFLLMARKAKDTARMLGISSMAQGIGYLGAGLGPWVFGLLCRATGAWTLSFSFFGSIIALWGVAACLAARRDALK